MSLVAFALVAGCHSTAVQTPAAASLYDPSRDLGVLFHDVQLFLHHLYDRFGPLGR